MLFPGGRRPYDERRIHQRVHNRLGSQPEFSAVRFHPSRIRPREVHADVDPARFVDDAYPAADARLELSFDVREGWNHYWIQWVEPTRGFACGWHQDGTHPELGECHFQVDYPDGSVERETATLLDAHPLAVVERRLAALPGRLDALRTGE